jgi:hypothetical protein
MNFVVGKPLHFLYFSRSYGAFLHELLREISTRE